MTTPVFTEDTILKRYKDLCEFRDAKYKETAPLEAKLNELNALTDKYRNEAAMVGAQIDTILGGESWIIVKKEICLLAKNLGRPNGPLAVKAKSE